MRILNQSHSMEKIEQLKPHPENPRRGNVQAISESIEINGFYGAVVAQKSTGHVLAGNHRLEAARKMRAADIPVIWVDCSNEEARKILLADNRTNDLATYDTEALTALLESIEKTSGDLKGTGYDRDALNSLLDRLGKPYLQTPLGDPEVVPEPPKVPVTKPGDLWLLGDHRLLCGDSTKEADVLRAMNGEKAILFATDPPYLVDYDGTNHPHKWSDGEAVKRRKNKDWSGTYGVTWDESKQGVKLYEEFYRMAVAHAVLPNAAWYCWHASRRQAMVEKVWNDNGAFVHQQIIWVKDRPVLTRCWYLWQHEPCLFGWLKSHKPNRVLADFDKTVWQVPTIAPGTSTEHPTSKPVELFRIPIRQHTKTGELCYEPFAGSGSQIIAAEELGRRCYGLEISPAYCDVIIQRYEAFSGKKARRG